MTRRQTHNLISTIGVTLLPLLVIDSFPWMASHHYHVTPDEKLLRSVLLFKLGWVLMSAASLGWAAGMRHPNNIPSYAAWLRTTPWRPGLPLPLGSVTPSLFDCVIATIFPLTLVLYVHLSPLPAFTAWMTGYSFAVMFSLARAGPGWVATVLWWAMGMLSLFFPRAMPMLIVSAGMFVLACWGSIRSMRDFQTAGIKPPKRSPNSAGPLLARLGPRRLQTPAEHRRRLAIQIVSALTIGWTLYCILVQTLLHQYIPLSASEAVLLAVFGIVVALGRLVIYCGGNPSPISSWGRLWTLNWIIPGYDYVFLAPLATLLVGCLFALAMQVAAVNATLAFPISITATLLVAMTAPPTLQRWKLTGHHRILLGPAKSQRGEAEGRAGRNGSARESNTEVAL